MILATFSRELVFFEKRRVGQEVTDRLKCLELATRFILIASYCRTRPYTVIADFLTAACVGVDRDARLSA
jgi:hypothetical protein